LLLQPSLMHQGIPDSSAGWLGVVKSLDYPTVLGNGDGLTVGRSTVQGALRSGLFRFRDALRAFRAVIGQITAGISSRRARRPASQSPSRPELTSPAPIPARRRSVYPAMRRSLAIAPADCVDGARLRVEVC
jgi:hypothetical protein